MRHTRIKSVVFFLPNFFSMFKISKNKFYTNITRSNILLKSFTNLIKIGNHCMLIYFHCDKRSDKKIFEKANWVLFDLNKWLFEKSNSSNCFEWLEITVTCAIYFFTYYIGC